MKKHFYHSFFLLLFLGFAQISLAQIPNASFESWTAGVPDGWTSDSAYLTQSFNPHNAGYYACEIKVVDAGSGYFITVPLLSGNDETPFFVCNCRPVALHFWYVFNSAGGETFNVTTTGIKNGGAFSGGSAYTGSGSNTVYKEGGVNYYYTGAGNADSVEIMFQIVGYPNSYTFHSGTFLRLDDLSFGAAVNTGISDLSQPVEVSIEKIQPNPAAEKTNIIYNLPSSAQVKLDIYDVTGRIVKTVVNENQTPGRYKAIVELNDMPAGAYFCRLNAGGTILSDKLSVIK